ncbi:MAG: Gfo/Idh/MocA family oxidoreductase [Anaerolineae bacterium]|nr:Gfo/Idh/MocA family oxidoreductase [Anaerolineae bacterium]
MKRPLRVGIFGARRGLYLGKLFDLHPQASVVALCEQDPQRRQEAKTSLPQLEAAYSEYASLLEHDIDVVVIANDATAHAPYAIQALEAGIHVFSEVLACKTLAEGVALARAVERSQALYSFAENCCYMRPALEMERIYQAGKVGEFIYGEAEYVHDCTGVWHRLTYGLPNHWRNWIGATVYCSHALGPILTITKTRPTRCVGFTTPNLLGRQVGRRGDDMGLIVCQMDNGALCKVLLATACRREPPSHWYSIYGTRGHMENTRGPGEEEVHIYREDDQGSEYHRKYVPSFPTKLPWARSMGGHGGADAQMVADFVQAVLQGGPPPIDVYTALDMTLPGILAFRSACEGNIPLEVPDLRHEEVRARYESDHWTSDPHADPSNRHSPSAHGEISIPPEVYAEQRRKYLNTLEE